MTDDPTEDLWTGLTVEFELRDVRLVATFGHDGGAIVENLRSLTCAEGRLYSYEARDDRELHTLQYIFSFGALAESDPMASSSAGARIVITGRHRNGHQIEIRGNGWFGYDDQGNVEGMFDVPPVIITEDPDLIQFEDAKIEPHARFPEFPMPPQYTRATLRVRNDRDPFDEP
jgi:hypothetical protein